MVKRTDSTDQWIIIDTERSVTNVMDDYLTANSSDAEVQGSASIDFDYLSNGFKARQGGTWSQNASGGTYIYIAFAEHPFKYSNAR